MTGGGGSPWPLLVSRDGKTLCRALREEMTTTVDGKSLLPVGKGGTTRDGTDLRVPVMEWSTTPDGGPSPQQATVAAGSTLPGGMKLFIPSIEKTTTDDGSNRGSTSQNGAVKDLPVIIPLHLPLEFLTATETRLWSIREGTSLLLIAIWLVLVRAMTTVPITGVPPTIIAGKFIS